MISTSYLDSGPKCSLGKYMFSVDTDHDESRTRIQVQLILIFSICCDLKTLVHLYFKDLFMVERTAKVKSEERVITERVLELNPGRRGQTSVLP